MPRPAKASQSASSPHLTPTPTLPPGPSRGRSKRARAHIAASWRTIGDEPSAAPRASASFRASRAKPRAADAKNDASPERLASQRMINRQCASTRKGRARAPPTSQAPPAKAKGEVASLRQRPVGIKPSPGHIAHVGAQRVNHARQGGHQFCSVGVALPCASHPSKYSATTSGRRPCTAGAHSRASCEVSLSALAAGRKAHSASSETSRPKALAAQPRVGARPRSCSGTRRRIISWRALRKRFPGVARAIQ